MAMPSAPRFRLLFVCMGNICRSPAAEGVMQKMLHDAGLSAQVQVDSAGTGGWHAGEKADHRMRSAAARRGYDLTSIARQVRAEDLRNFDLVLAMDHTNLQDLRPFDDGSSHLQRVRLFCEFCENHEETEVPDPYYGGASGFDHVLDLLEDGCRNLLSHVRQQLHA